MDRDVEHLIDRLHDSVVGTEDPNIAGPDDITIEEEPSDDEVSGVAEAGGVPPAGS